MQKRKAFEFKTTGILICAVYSVVIFLNGILGQISRNNSTFLKTIFEYRALTGRLFNISVCVFLFLLYFYNKEKANLKALKVNTIISGCLLMLVLLPYFSNAINDLHVQANGFHLSGGNSALMSILLILMRFLPMVAFMLMVILKYKRTMVAVFLSLEAINVAYNIYLQIDSFNSFQKYSFQLINSTGLLFQNIFFFILSTLYTILLATYAINVEWKRNQTENN